MPRFDYIYTGFSSGEISPLLEGRVELERYSQAAKILENFYIKPHGPAIRRGGSRYVAKAKLDATFEVTLISFVNDLTEQFILEFGDLYIRFFTEKGQLVGDGAGFPLDQPYEIVSPYAHTQGKFISRVQNENFLYLAHVSHPPSVLERVDTYNWTLNPIVFTGAPPEWIAGNYPGVVGFFEERLYFGGTVDQPNTIWASKIGDYTNFTIGTNDDDAFKYTLQSGKYSRIYHFSAGEDLIVLTSGAEYKVGSTDFNETITPTNIKVTRRSNYGTVKRIQPVRIGPDMLFAQKGVRKVRALKYLLERDTYVAEDITFLNQHITEPGLDQVAYVNEPDSIVWYLRQDGQLVGITYDAELEIWGAFRYTTKGTITALASIDGWQDSNNDELWIAVDRLINGQTVKYIEFFVPSLQLTQSIEDSFYVDSGLSLPDNQLPATVVTNLDHLEGEVVHILVDGWVHPPQTVIGGSVTLNTTATKAVHAGLPFTSTLRTLRPEGGNPIGTSQGKTKRISEVQIRLYRSLGLKVGDQKLDWDFFGPPVMNQANELFTGDREIDIDDDYSFDAELTIVQDQPLPTTIIAIMPEIRTK